MSQFFKLTHQQIEGAIGLAFYVSVAMENGFEETDDSSIARSLWIAGGKHDGVLLSGFRAATGGQE